jgi:threonine efflux protein
LSNAVIEQAHALIVVYTLYVIATASPGPSNMTIMSVAMSRGRLPALVLVAGIMTGSITWALLAAMGISTLLSAYANALVALKIGGGLYLIYLAVKSAKAAWKPALLDRMAAAEPVVLGKLYRRGLMLHLTNPKAILSWVAIMSLGLKSDAAGHITLAIIGGCATLGVTIFGGYAILFSMPVMVRLYQRTRRWIEATLALFFGVAGFRLLLTRI